jgi:hypothetical protein
MKRKEEVIKLFKELGWDDFARSSSRTKLLNLSDEEFFRNFSTIISFLEGNNNQALVAAEMITLKKGNPRFIIHLPELLKIEPHQEQVGKAIYDVIISFKGKLGVRAFYKELKVGTRSNWMYIQLASKFLLDTRLILVE